MTGSERTRRFEVATLAHLDAAYNLARWLLRDDQAAQDVVQEAYLRAFRFFDGFRGGDARPWLLGIVRNACYTWLSESSASRASVEFDEERDGDAIDPAMQQTVVSPEALLECKLDRARVNLAIAKLPSLFREVLILREFEELSYGEIARVAGIPVGTVMSRLARARAMLRASLTRSEQED